MTLCGETYWLKNPHDVKLSSLERSCYSSGRLINLVNTNVIKNLLYFFMFLMFRKTFCCVGNLCSNLKVCVFHDISISDSLMKLTEAATRGVL